MGKTLPTQDRAASQTATPAKERELVALLNGIARQYSEELQANQLDDVARIAFHIELVRSRCGVPCRVADLGGGVGLFSVGCAAVGMDSVLVDDFSDSVNLEFGDRVLDLHRSHGVEVRARDIVAEGIDFPPESLDCVTCFGAVEHFHHSPRKLFRQVAEALVPGGLFILAAPNCVNLRKRIGFPLGRVHWSRFEDWYEPDEFRGHVREPSAGDLRRIAEDMRLDVIGLLGRNWTGHASRSSAVRFAARVIDVPLRTVPQLCSDLYLLASKPR